MKKKAVKKAPPPSAPPPKQAVDATPVQEFAQALARACRVCERGAALTKFSTIVFNQGRFQATDGVVQIQGKSIFDPASNFTLSESKLAQALALIAPVDAITEGKEAVLLKRGPMSLRIKKGAPELGFWDPFKISKGAKKAEGLLAALRKVEAFMSDDSTRPWSLAVLLNHDYAWATNNLALVRTPLPALFKGPIAIPMPAVKLLCELESIDYIEEVPAGRITLVSGKLLYRFSASAMGWPDVMKMFAKLPKKMPPLPPEMKDAAHATSRLSDRFVSVGANKVESKSTAVDATYEVDLAKGTGTFSAKILSLIAQVATHAEFSFFPEPIFFRGEGIEGTAVGAKQI